MNGLRSSSEATLTEALGGSGLSLSSSHALSSCPSPPAALARCGARRQLPGHSDAHSSTRCLPDTRQAEMTRFLRGLAHVDHSPPACLPDHSGSAPRAAQRQASRVQGAGRCRRGTRSSRASDSCLRVRHAQRPRRALRGRERTPALLACSPARGRGGRELGEQPETPGAGR